jgi:Flp pilus assembly protein TadG
MTAVLPMWDRHRLRGAEEGATAVETAIVLPAFMLVVFGIVEFTQIFWTWNTMLLALEEAGRYAMVYHSGPPASCADTLANCAVARANDVLSAYPSPSVAVSCSAGCTGTPTAMTIQGTFTYNFVASGLLPYGPITMTQSVTVPLI